MACGTEFGATPFRLTCETCGGNLDLMWDHAAIVARWRRSGLRHDGRRDLWRYLPLLPVEDMPENTSLQVGGTPLVNFRRTAAELGLARLWLKDDCRNPSSSLKDRASEVGIRHATELGQDTLVTASTGNAAASLAALCAFHRKRAVILAPASAPEAKLVQIRQYGARLFRINGTYDQAFDLTTAITAVTGWYNRSTGVNPVMTEGKKTVALEIAEELDWRPPDHVLVPVGDGCIIGGVYKGFADLLAMGWVEYLPRITAVQAAGSASICNALISGEPLEDVSASTLADSIAVDHPRDALKALRAVRESKGGALIVSDDEILAAQQELSRKGMFAEPAAATAWAGLRPAMAQGLIKPGETVCVLVTGSGLKDIAAAGRRLAETPVIEPTLSAFEEQATRTGLLTD
jgi:threonine synthase